MAKVYLEQFKSMNSVTLPASGGVAGDIGWLWKGPASSPPNGAVISSSLSSAFKAAYRSLSVSVYVNEEEFAFEWNPIAKVVATSVASGVLTFLAASSTSTPLHVKHNGALLQTFNCTPTPAAYSVAYTGGTNVEFSFEIDYDLGATDDERSVVINEIAWIEDGAFYAQELFTNLAHGVLTTQNQVGANGLLWSAPDSAGYIYDSVADAAAQLTATVNGQNISALSAAGNHALLLNSNYDTKHRTNELGSGEYVVSPIYPGLDRRKARLTIPGVVGSGFVHVWFRKYGYRIPDTRLNISRNGALLAQFVNAHVYCIHRKVPFSGGTDVAIDLEMPYAPLVGWVIIPCVTVQEYN